MTDSIEFSDNCSIVPQCQFFVVRKKRLCRMTVRPGRHYCGEHEPQPKTDNGQVDTRIPCPYDPKHTCYASKLEKHLVICNARQHEVPPYIVHNINAPTEIDTCPRLPLGEIARESLVRLIEKVNYLYEKHVQDNITTIPEAPIHRAVLDEFTEGDRTESSRRHLRQASSLLHIAEDETLVRDCTCYVELGAGKGQLSYYAGVSWCVPTTNSRVALIDRASLRHKRDNKLPQAACRLRADLAHLALHHVPVVADCDAVVGFAKHLCGVATDYALRCITCPGVLEKTRGLVLATCCHHRCERSGYVANTHLQELGINGEELNIMLGVVSWATCGDGRSRRRRAQPATLGSDDNIDDYKGQNHVNIDDHEETNVININDPKDIKVSNINNHDDHEETNVININDPKDIKVSNINNHDDHEETSVININDPKDIKVSNINNQDDHKETNVININDPKDIKVRNINNHDDRKEINVININDHEKQTYVKSKKENVDKYPVLSQKYREMVGRRAKALLDWGRVLYLREKGFDAKLCHYVPITVSLENVCIVAKKGS